MKILGGHQPVSLLLFQNKAPTASTSKPATENEILAYFSLPWIPFLFEMCAPMGRRSLQVVLFPVACSPPDHMLSCRCFRTGVFVLL